MDTKLDVLNAQLYAGDAETRRTAARELATTWISTQNWLPIEMLAKAIETGNAEVREAAAEGLLDIPVAAEWFARFAGEGRISADAVLRLSESRDERVLPMLRELLGSILQDVVVRGQYLTYAKGGLPVVVEALLRQGAAGQEALNDVMATGTVEVRQHLVMTLAKNPPLERLDFLISFFSRAICDAELEVRLSAGRGLEKCGSAGLATLVALTADRDYEARVAAGLALGWALDRRAVAALCEGLADEREEIHRRAAHLLGEMQAVEAVEALIRTLEYAGNHGAWAAAALGKIGTPTAVAALKSKGFRE